MAFDLTTKKTESEWAEVSFLFIKDTSEAIFRVIGWCAVVSAIGVANKKIDSQALAAMQALLSGIIYIYTYSYFANRFEIVISKERRIMNFFVTAAISLPSMILCQHLCTQTVDALITAAIKR